VCLATRQVCQRKRPTRGLRPTEPRDERRHQPQGACDNRDADPWAHQGNHDPDHHTKAAEPDLPDQHHWSHLRRRHATIVLRERMFVDPL